MEKLLRMELTSKPYFSYKINPDLLVGCSRLMTVRTLYTPPKAEPVGAVGLSGQLLKFARLM